MKKFLFFSILICLFLIQGCAGGQWVRVNYASVVYENIKGKYIKNYEIGQEKKAYIGQEIIIVREYSRNLYKKIKVVIPQEDIHIKAKHRTSYYYLVIEANKEYRIEGIVEKDNKSFSVIKVLDDGGQEWGVLIDDKGLLVNTSIYSYYYSMIFIPIKISMTPNIYKFSIQESFENTDASPVQSFELIYSGKNDISLNATYREYTSNDLARPSFFQNLTYQANAKQIRFKDFLIQIHNVTNEQITYTILEDGLK